MPVKIRRDLNILLTEFYFSAELCRTNSVRQLTSKSATLSRNNSVRLST